METENKKESEIEEFKRVEFKIDTVDVGECRRPGCSERILLPRAIAESGRFEMPDRCGACGIMENRIADEKLYKIDPIERAVDQVKQKEPIEVEDKKKAAAGDRDEK